MSTLRCRPELLRGWLADSRNVVVSMTLDHSRMLIADALAAHDLHGALTELVNCKELKSRFERMEPGRDRAALLQEYMDNVGPAWDAAFKVLGAPRYEAALPTPTPRRADHALHEVANG